jgi:hypothetical protein
MPSYESDLYEWTKAQADALRRRASNELDWDNLAEEIETLGRSERREIQSRLKNLLLHLLKWRYQPERQCGSWRGSIAEAREELEAVLSDNPSLRSSLPAEYLSRAYASARAKALDETGLLRLPNDCPWTIDEILSPEFLP